MQQAGISTGLKVKLQFWNSWNSNWAHSWYSNWIESEDVKQRHSMWNSHMESDFNQWQKLFETTLSACHGQSLPRPKFHSQVLTRRRTSYTLLPRLPSEAAESAQRMGNPETLVLAELVWDCRGRVASQKQGDEGDSAYHVVNWGHIKARNWARLVQFEHSSVLHRSIDGQVKLLKRGWTRGHQGRFCTTGS